MNQYDNLRNLTVYQLRTLARNMGVKAPTTKTVDVLIKEIIEIKKGNLEPKKSKMGRPPKSQSNNLVKIIEDSQTKSISNLGYENIKEYYDIILENDEEVENIGECNKFFGVVREQNSELFVKNYENNFDYVILFSNDKVSVRAGDLVVGKATSFKMNFGKSNQYEKYNFKNSEVLGQKALVKVCEEQSEAYNYINNQNGNNFIVEVEANTKTIMTEKNGLFFYTEECEDIIKSYNMLMDIKEMVKNLVNENKTFSLYFIDVEYIYSILSMYYEYKKIAADINAGQYFKEILSSIKNCENANIVLFEKKGGIRSSYLDIILNKYCEFE